MEHPIEPNAGSKYDFLALIFALLVPSIVTVVYFQILAGTEPAVEQTAYIIGKTIQFGFPVVWVWMFYRHRLRWSQQTQALPPQSQSTSLVANLPWSIGFGLLVVVTMFAIFFGGLQESEIGIELAAKVQEKVNSIGANTQLKYFGLGIFYALCHSFLEEYYWRWFVFPLCKRYTTALVANLVSSLGFAAHHVILLGFYFGWNSPLTYLFSLLIAVGGAFWAWQYERTGRIWAPWISHMIVDAGIFSLGYYMLGGDLAG